MIALAIFTGSAVAVAYVLIATLGPAVSRIVALFRGQP